MKASSLCKKATIHRVTTMLVIFKNVLFPSHNHLLTIWHFDYCPSTSESFTRISLHSCSEEIILWNRARNKYRKSVWKVIHYNDEISSYRTTWLLCLVLHFQSRHLSQWGHRCHVWPYSFLCLQTSSCKRNGQSAWWLQMTTKFSGVCVSMYGLTNSLYPSWGFMFLENGSAILVLY